ncbi:hypothetical protein A2U01_0091291, partial [Trifolium medium]|nr:hypothetical protein [Trifolium medium]
MKETLVLGRLAITIALLIAAQEISA